MERKALETFGLPLLSRTIVVAREPGGFSAGQASAAAGYIAMADRREAELLPVILTAALMIAGATLTLLLSGLSFLSAFGPSMAVAVVVSALVAMTLVPAALAIFGRALLWPRGLRGQPPGDDEQRGRRASEGGGARGLLLGVAVRVPVLTALVCLAGLLVAASCPSSCRSPARSSSSPWAPTTTVFLISGIWQEGERRELRPAIRTAGIRAGRAITVAGLILALSFAAVALIPIQGFARSPSPSSSASSSTPRSPAPSWSPPSSPSSSAED